MSPWGPPRHMLHPTSLRALQGVPSGVVVCTLFHEHSSPATHGAAVLLKTGAEFLLGYSGTAMGRGASIRGTGTWMRGQRARYMRQADLSLRLAAHEPCMRYSDLGSVINRSQTWSQPTCVTRSAASQYSKMCCVRVRNSTHCPSSSGESGDSSGGKSRAF